MSLLHGSNPLGAGDDSMSGYYKTYNVMTGKSES